MSTTVHPFALRLVERLVEPADVAVAVVGPFALGIGVVHDQTEARPVARGGPLQHLQIAVGVAERHDRAAADEPVDADRLAGAVVDELDLGFLEEDRLAVRLHLELHHARGADHLLGRDAVDPLGEHAHELDAAARDDEGLEALRAQIGEQLEHRLIGELGVRPVEPRMASGGEPVGDDRPRTPRSSCRYGSPP